MWRKSRADFPFCRSFGIVHPLMRKKKKNLSEENRSFFVSIFPQKRKTKLQTCMLLIDWQSWQCVIQSQQCADRALNCVCVCVCMPHGRNKLCTKNEFIRWKQNFRSFWTWMWVPKQHPSRIKRNWRKTRTEWNLNENFLKCSLSLSFHVFSGCRGNIQPKSCWDKSDTLSCKAPKNA